MKMTFFFFVVCILNLYPQWNKIDIIPEEYIYTIYDYGDTLYAATDSLIYVSRDQGISWSVFSAQSVKNTEAIIRIDNTLYIGTYGDGVFKSSDDGISFESFNNGLTAWSKYIVQFYKLNNRLYLGSDGGGVYYLDLADPVRWIEYNENLPSLVGWSVICITGINDKLIISSGASGFIHTRREGTSGWVSGYIDSIKTPQPLSLLTAGNHVFAGTVRTIYRSSDSGITWDSVGISAIPLRSKVIKSFGNTVYAGVTRPNEFWIWTSADSGITWQFMDHQFFELLDLHITGNYIFAATGSGLYRNKLMPVSVPAIINSYMIDNISVYPNPFNPTATIKTEISEHGFVQLSIFNILGEKISEIFRGDVDRGVHEYTINGFHLSGGIYIIVLTVNGKHYSKKIILLK